MMVTELCRTEIDEVCITTPIVSKTEVGRKAMQVALHATLI
jgi:hypothetical protein